MRLVSSIGCSASLAHIDQEMMVMSDAVCNYIDSGISLFHSLIFSGACECCEKCDENGFRLLTMGSGPPELGVCLKPWSKHVLKVVR